MNRHEMNRPWMNKWMNEVIEINEWMNDSIQNNQVPSIRLNWHAWAFYGNAH
jgi:hypothetical protein